MTEEGSWRRTGDIVREEIMGITTNYPIIFPYTNTYIQIKLQAHNEYGYSSEAILVIRAMKGFKCSFLFYLFIKIVWIGKVGILGSQISTPSQLPLVPIIGTVVCVLLICIILIDVSCYKVNKIGRKNLYNLNNLQFSFVSGVTNFLCEKTKSFKKFDAQSER